MKVVTWRKWRTCHGEEEEVERVGTGCEKRRRLWSLGSDSVLVQWL